MLWLQLTLTGLQTGALYALTAVGFSLIFGATRVFHFAHGAAFVLAAYVFYWVDTAGLGMIPGIVLAALAAMAFGVAMDRLVYAPIQRHEGSFFTVFVASFGVGIAVQNIVGMVFGRGFVTMNSTLSRSREIVDGVYVAPLAWIAIACAAVFFALLQFFLRRTHTGMALRALADSPELIRVYGLDPRRLSSYAFALGSVLVVPGAVITALGSGLNPALGHHVMLISLAATIVGGIGSIGGALVAGFVLGLAENLALIFFQSQWTEAVTFAILFLVILLRPSGLFGRAAAH
ncbi:ABC transporter permease [Defluviimonas sp. 20V17]|uniref:Amino acid/amide ABC transporter membrane protein 1, HAAT family n=1 Tax=Allgaiera indica TaxID=765699 RepID=A0AAN5A0A6_9RHOB|nr:branched-chain amino acid ABC transporter permease [Allgaiera indica]KDB01728.1 ABC transporter permease [Defluviimonas sp. 20V17]GHE04045.1 branched-chain amino acid ABC transporter permease [Allgaiera indica]SDX33649.1 amino acid/amide ABC transporter membrane protein 1, HAAT family [Allgaiera indica]